MGPLQALKLDTPGNSSVIGFQPDDMYLMAGFGDKKQKIEYYRGHGFNSCSTRKIYLPSGVEDLYICKFDGTERRILIDKID